MKAWYEHRSSLRLKLLGGGLGIILLIGLLSFGTGIYFCAKIDRALEIRNSVGRILAQKARARSAEKDFRLADLINTEFYESGNTKNLTKHQDAIIALEKEILELTRLFPDEADKRVQKLNELVHEYAQDFLDLAAAYRERGFKEWRLAGEWHRAMHNVEEYVGRTESISAIRALLALKHDEADFHLYNEDRYVDALSRDISQLEGMVHDHDGPGSATLLQTLQDYDIALRNYVLIQRTIGLTEDAGLQGALQRAAQAMDPIIQDIHAKAIQVSDNGRQNLVRVMSLVWGMGLGLGGMFFYFHARSIADPIIQLKDAALKIGHGEFDINIAPQSNDEVGILANAFNQMVADVCKTQQALRQSEEQSRLIIETANDAFIGTDQDGVVMDWNRQAEIVFGWSREEAIGRSLEDTIIPPQHRQPHIKKLRHFLATDEGQVINTRLELVALHRDGREFPVELTAWPIQTAQTRRLNAFVHDITERKQAEEVLRQSEQRFRTLTTHAPVGIFLTDAQGDYLVRERALV
jgi:PAS domain S-box-containing protein